MFFLEDFFMNVRKTFELLTCPLMAIPRKQLQANWLNHLEKPVKLIEQRYGRRDLKMGLTVERWRRQKWTHKHKHGHNMPEGIPMWEEHGPCSLHKTAFVLSYQANRYCIKWAAKTCYWQQKTHIICVHKHKKKHTLSHLLSEPYHKILTPLIRPLCVTLLKMIIIRLKPNP